MKFESKDEFVELIVEYCYNKSYEMMLNKSDSRQVSFTLNVEGKALFKKYLHEELFINIWSLKYIFEYGTGKNFYYKDVNLNYLFEDLFLDITEEIENRKKNV